MKKITHRFQRRDHTCGPACLRMVLAACGKNFTEDALSTQARTTERFGTRNAAMVSVLRAHGVPARLTCRLTRRTLGDLLRRSIPVIVHYRVPGDEVGHFAVAVGYTSDAVVLHDPWLGPLAHLSWKDFLRRWYGLKNAPKGHGRGIIVGKNVNI